MEAEEQKLEPRLPPSATPHSAKSGHHHGHLHPPKSPSRRSERSTNGAADSSSDEEDGGLKLNVHRRSRKGGFRVGLSETKEPAAYAEHFHAQPAREAVFTEPASPLSASAASGTPRSSSYDSYLPGRRSAKTPRSPKSPRSPKTPRSAKTPRSGDFGADAATHRQEATDLQGHRPDHLHSAHRLMHQDSVDELAPTPSAAIGRHKLPEISVLDHSKHVMMLPGTGGTHGHHNLPRVQLGDADDEEGDDVDDNDDAEKAAEDTGADEDDKKHARPGERPAGAGGDEARDDQPHTYPALAVVPRGRYRVCLPDAERGPNCTFVFLLGTVVAQVRTLKQGVFVSNELTEGAVDGTEGNCDTFFFFTLSSSRSMLPIGLAMLTRAKTMMSWRRKRFNKSATAGGCALAEFISYAIVYSFLLFFLGFSTARRKEAPG